MDKKGYVLIHVVNFQEFYTPLVLSQVFDQANIQLHKKNEISPDTVEVWIPVPLRVWFDFKFLKYKKTLQERFPKLTIRFLSGIDRLKGFPSKQLISQARRKYKSTCCIFHFRGDDLLASWDFLKQTYPKDKFVVDVRGLWAAEKLLLEGIEIFDIAELQEYESSKFLVNRLITNIKYSDALTTVSINLLHTLKEMSGYTKPMWVVPCCVRVEPLGDKANTSLGQIPTIGYLGGTAVYQNLADLVFPLFADILKIRKVNILILTHQPEVMTDLIKNSSISSDSIVIKSLPQEKVSEELINMDLGFLTRRNNLVNRVAQPVKIGEYLSAGVPVCVEGDLGGLDQITKGVLHLNIEEEGFIKSAQKVVDYLEKTTSIQRRKDAHESATQFFSWEKNIRIHQKNYTKLLNAH